MSCFPMTPEPDQRATSIQCCTLFWGLRGVGNGTPLAEPHRNPYNLPNYLRLLGKAKNSGCARSNRMRLRNNVFDEDHAPGTCMIFTSRVEVNRAVRFV